VTNAAKLINATKLVNASKLVRIKHLRHRTITTTTTTTTSFPRTREPHFSCTPTTFAVLGCAKESDSRHDGF
jgi:hypothetical protein